MNCGLLGGQYGLAGLVDQQAYANVANQQAQWVAQQYLNQKPKRQQSPPYDERLLLLLDT